MSNKDKDVENKKGREITAAQLKLKGGLGKAKGGSDLNHFSDEKEISKVYGRGRLDTSGSWKDVENPLYSAGKTSAKNNKPKGSKTLVKSAQPSLEKQFPLHRKSFAVQNPMPRDEDTKVVRRQRVHGDNTTASEAIKRVKRPRT